MSGHRPHGAGTGGVVSLVAFVLTASLFVVQAQGTDDINEAINTVKTMREQGRSRAEIAAWVTQIVANRITSLNHTYPARDGRQVTGAELEAMRRRFIAWRDAGVDVDAPFSAADWAWKNRMGQCSENAHTAFHILAMGLQSTDSICEVAVGDHTYVILGDVQGIQEGTSLSELQRRADTWVVDPWDNTVISTANLRWYHYTQVKFGLKQINRVSIVPYQTYTRLHQRWVETSQRNPNAYRAWLTGLQPPPTPGDISGRWRRADGHEVSFSGSGAAVTGTIVTLTPRLAALKFEVGEETFVLKQTGAGKYIGKVKWRSTERPPWWQEVTMTVSGDRMSGAGEWDRVR